MAASQYGPLTPDTKRPKEGGIGKIVHLQSVFPKPISGVVHRPLSLFAPFPSALGAFRLRGRPCALLVRVLGQGNKQMRATRTAEKGKTA